MNDEIDPDLLAAVTKVVRAADYEYGDSGGTGRHWVRDHFMPCLAAAGLQVTPTETREGSRPQAPEVTEAMVEAGAKGLRVTDHAVLTMPRYRQIARAVLEAALAATTEGGER